MPILAMLTRQTAAAEGGAPADAETATGSLTASHAAAAPGSARPAKRQRQAGGLAQQQLRNKHLHNASLDGEPAVVAHTNSGVDSSQQVDRTGSCDPVHRRSVDAATEEEQEPSAKRRRLQRVGVPSSMRPTELRVQDRCSPPWRSDDSEGHYVFEIGENLAPRFKVMRKFGEGTFGQVLECWDRRRRDYVAVKVIRNIQKYRDAAMVELEALSTLSAHDPQQSHHCVKLLDWFDYRGHVCMVFERLGPSMYDYLRRNAYRPFPLAMARDFTRQMLECVAYMHRLELVHTDLKPENILFLDAETSKEVPPAGSKLGRRMPASSAIRVIDFGSATFESDYHSSVVSTRHYRAPEVILGVGWSYPCDLFSIGCILVELLTGDALFQTHEDMEHLAMMEAVLGPIPEAMAAAADDSTRKLFKRRLNWPERAESKRSIKAVQKLKRLRELLKNLVDDTAKPFLDLATDLITRLMAYEPAKRITAEAALQHDFFHAKF